MSSNAPTESGRIYTQRQRQVEIALYVVESGTARIEDIAARFGVSSMTIRRDLDDLEAKSILRRTYGHATALSSGVFEASSLYRRSQQTREKTMLARAVLQLIEPGEALMIDDSTTGLFLAPLLSQRTPLRVVTNFMGLALEMFKESGITVSLLGGQYHAWCDATLGAMTVEAIKNIRVDTLVMSTSAVMEYTCYHHAEETDMVKRAMLETAQRRILYLDHTKFTRRAMHRLVPMSSFDIIVLDELTPKEHVTHLRQLGVQVIVA